MSGEIGTNPGTPQATPELQGKSFNLGDRYESDTGDEFLYVQADGSVTGEGYVCIVSAAYQAAMVTTSNDLVGGILAVAPVAFADNDYGWMQVYGTCNVRVSASCAANVPLNATATAGQLDDDATALALVAGGIFLTTARAASAGTAPATLNWSIVAPDAAAELAQAGVTATAAELNYLDITTLGTGAASKAVVLDAGDDYTWPATGVLTLGVLKDVAGTTLGATAQELNNSSDVSFRVQQLTASGAVTAGVQSVELNHATVVIAATVVTAVNHPGLFVIKDTSATGTAAHTVTLTAGTFNGTNNVATLDARDEMLVVYFDSAGRGQIIVNVGGVALS